MKKRPLSILFGGLLVLLLTGLLFSCLKTKDSVAVTALSGYTNIVAISNTAIGNQSPTVTPSGATGTYAIEPALPTGLTLDTATGSYTGTASQEITIATDAPPGAPTIGPLIPGDTQVTVSWTAPTDTGYNDGVAATITGYTVYYSKVLSFTKDSKPAGGTDTEIVVDGLTNGTTYYFLVTAMNSSGEGESSTIESATAGYTVGSPGPAGRRIFYVKDAYSDGWRYLEAITSDQSTSIARGGYETEVGGTSTNIGTGEANTGAIVTVLTTTYVADICFEYSTTVDSNTFDNWFLPPKDELKELYEQRITAGGLFDQYWSSSEYYPNYAWKQFFGEGYQYSDYKDNDLHVRSVRAF